MTLRILPVNHFDSATIAVTPAAVTTLPVTNLQSSQRDRVWRSPNLDQQVITGDWGGNVRVVSAWGVWPADSSSLIGSTWRLQLYSDVAKATQVYDSGVLDFFTATGAAWNVFEWGATPWGVEAGDRTARLAPMLKFIAAANASAFTMTVNNGGAVDTPYLESRRIWMADYVAAPYNASYGAAPAWVSSSKPRRTIGGSLRRASGARWRELRFDTELNTEADRAAWMDISYVCDPALEIVLDLFPANASPRLERDYTVMGSLETLSPMPWENYSIHRLDFAITES